MTKILMTSVRPDEQAAIRAAEARLGVEIVTSPELIKDALPLLDEVDGVVIQERGAVPAAVYPALKTAGIRQLTTRTAGYDMIDLAAARENGLTVTNVPAYSPRSVAEFALMQTFRLLRHTAQFDHRVAQSDFRWTPDLQAKEIHSATVGIIGVGRIGSTLAQLLHALGARVLGFDRAPRTDLAGVVEFTDKQTLLKESDVVSLHVDLNPSSVGLLDAADFALMKPTAGLVNASRGPVVNTDALIAALKAGQLAGAALDTVEGEAAVFNQDHRQDQLAASPQIKELAAMEQVIITPHIAFFTNIAVQNMVDIALDDVCAILQGQAPKNAVK